MLDETTEITFKSLPENVQKALLLLHKVRERARTGVKNHSKEICPIHCGYGIATEDRWSELRLENRSILEKADWNEILYNEFIRWYDLSIDLFVQFFDSRDSDNENFKIRISREKFLTKFLAQQIAPQMTQ